MLGTMESTFHSAICKDINETSDTYVCMWFKSHAWKVGNILSGLLGEKYLSLK